MKLITLEARAELSRILEQVAIALDISDTQHNNIVASYDAVGSWLSAPDSLLARYKPIIGAQGSFILGTMIPPTNGRDDLDVDLVCRLTGKKPEWTQYHLKQIVGNRLKDHRTYKKMLDEEGRRCWTLNYADSVRYHMDILPSLTDLNYQVVLESALSDNNPSRAQNLAIRITDKYESLYRSATDPAQWPKSNPFGYAAWFYDLARLDLFKAYSLREAVQPLPRYQREKYPLQRVVQLLKWHRDQVFNGDAEKPISIIVTTLAARAYQKQTDLTQALTEIAGRLGSLIEERYDPRYGRMIKWISNPVNPEENFADKWPENAQLEKKFFEWVGRLQEDLDSIMEKVGLGFHKIREAMEKPFGEKVVNTAFGKFGDNARIEREKGSLKMAAATGTLGTFGRTVVGNHNNFGANE